MKKNKLKDLGEVPHSRPHLEQLEVDETFLRSHGLALNLYELDVNAPTGQICTVLPEKYDLKGSSGNVLT